jgi:hypothetical protein
MRNILTGTCVTQNYQPSAATPVSSPNSRKTTARPGSARVIHRSTASGLRRSKLPDASGNVGAIHLRNAPHLSELRLQLVLGQTPTYPLARHPFMLRQPDHRSGQKPECPAFPPLRRTSGLVSIRHFAGIAIQYAPVLICSSFPTCPLDVILLSE